MKTLTAVLSLFLLTGCGIETAMPEDRVLQPGSGITDLAPQDGGQPYAYVPCSNPGQEACIGEVWLFRCEAPIAGNPATIWVAHNDVSRCRP